MKGSKGTKDDGGGGVKGGANGSSKVVEEERSDTRLGSIDLKVYCR